MDFERLAIPDVVLLKPRKFDDPRGSFSETYNKKALVEAGIALDFVQDNHSLSHDKYVLRGLHFQLAPHAQGKLVRVSRGAAFDVAVDLRKGSPSFGQHVSQILSAENWYQLWVPPGFAHGFLALEPETEFLYKVTSYYAPQSDSGLPWNDPIIDIKWPLPEGEAPVLSGKDEVHAAFDPDNTYFDLSKEAVS